jgi:hypothetical protein
MPWTEADLAARGYDANGKRIDRPPAFELLSPKGRHIIKEERLQTEIVRVVRPLLIPQARMLGTNGEIPGGDEVRWRAARRKGMGYLRGMPDLLVRGPSVLVWLEVKVPPNRPTDEQKEFGAWALSLGDQWAVVTSVQEVRQIMENLGMLR